MFNLFQIYYINSSLISLNNACSKVSLNSTLPPGNSHFNPKYLSLLRWVIKYLLFFLMTAATTFLISFELIIQSYWHRRLGSAKGFKRATADNRLLPASELQRPSKTNLTPVALTALLFNLNNVVHFHLSTDSTNTPK